MDKIKLFLLAFNQGLSGRGHADRALIGGMPEAIKELIQKYDCLAYSTGNKKYTFAVLKEMSEDDIKGLKVMFSCGIWYYAAEFAKNKNNITPERLLSITTHLAQLENKRKTFEKENQQRKQDGLSYNDAYIIINKNNKRFFTCESVNIFKACKSIFAATVAPEHINGFLRLTKSERKTVKKFFGSVKTFGEEGKLLKAVCIKN